MSSHKGGETDRLTRNLELLNERIGRQLSVWRAFRNGIIYGMGFVVGSILVTSILVSVVLRYFDGTILGDTIGWFAERGS